MLNNETRNQLNQKHYKQRTNQQPSIINRFMTKQLSKIIGHDRNQDQQLSLSNDGQESPQSPNNNFQSNHNQQEFQHCVYYIAKSFKKLKIKTIEYYLNKILRPEQQRKKIKQSCIGEFTAEQDAKFSIKMPLIKLPTNVQLTDEQLTAASFVNYAYGLRVLKRIIEPFIPQSRYNNSIGKVIKLTFRKIEERMRIFGNSIISVSQTDQERLRNQLMNCFRWLPLDELYTFLRYVKLTLHLEQMAINPHDTTKLYTSLMKKLQERLMTNNGQKNKQIKMEEESINSQMYSPSLDYSVYNPQITYPSNNFLLYNPQVNYIPIPNQNNVPKNNSSRKRMKQQQQTKELQNLSATDGRQLYQDS